MAVNFVKMITTVELTFTTDDANFVSEYNMLDKFFSSLLIVFIFSCSHCYQATIYDEIKVFNKS